MYFDQATEKIEAATTIEAVKNIIQKTSKYEREAIKDYARARGWEV